MTVVRAETIFALSSGRPPAGIAVVRISGPAAGEVLRRMAGRLPEPRHASLAALRAADAALLDRAMILWLPGPRTVTGDDVVELHLHGGRAVVDAVLRSLGAQPGLRQALPGEFTRRAFENGRIDLNEAEGLADLLAAETESQRRAALLNADGTLSRLIGDWQARLLSMSAAIEASIDYSDEEDAPADAWANALAQARELVRELEAVLARPPAERLRDGVRVVLAGPPNSGKSSLVNALAGREAAIESDTPGTTRDVIEVPLAISGTPFLFLDTAGIRETNDAVEKAGVCKAHAAIGMADILVWLGDDEGPPLPSVIRVHARADQRLPRPDRLNVSAKTGLNLDVLRVQVTTMAAQALPAEGEVALTRRQRNAASELMVHLRDLPTSEDLLVAAEHLRVALAVCDRLTGRAGIENMFDDLFSRFCIGK